MTVRFGNFLSVPVQAINVQRSNAETSVVQCLTHMRMDSGSSPTSVDHREDFIKALSCFQSDVK